MATDDELLAELKVMVTPDVLEELSMKKVRALFHTFVKAASWCR